MRVRFILPGAMTLLAVAMLPAQTAADCSLAGPIADEIGEAEVAFVGTVATTSAGGSAATFSVEEVWKGTLSAEVEVRGVFDSPGPSEDDRSWVIGERYLVIPIVDAGVLRDYICTATVVWRPELTELRPPGVLPAPTATAPPGPGTALLLVAIAGMIALGVAVLLIPRRSPPC